MDRVAQRGAYAGIPHVTDENSGWESNELLAEHVGEGI